MLNLTNATKAVWIGGLNALFQFSEAFGLYDFSDAKEAAVLGLFNAIALIYVAVTYTSSPKRLPEGLEKNEDPPPAVVPEEANN